MASYFDIRGTATKILTATIGTLTIGTLLVIGANARLAGDLIPSSDNTYDVGTSTHGWRDGTFKRSLKTPELCLLGDCRSVWPTGGGGGGSGTEWTDNGVFLSNTTPTRGVVAWTSLRTPFVMATSTGISISASGTAALTNMTATNATTTNASSTAFFSTNGNVTSLRFTGATGTSGSVTGIWSMGTATGTNGNFNSAAIGVLTGGNSSFAQSTSTFLAFTNGSGTALTLNNKQICLADGTNCPSSGGGTITSSTWQFNQTSNIAYLTTSTQDLLVGGNTTATAGFIVDRTGSGVSQLTASAMQLNGLGSLGSFGGFPTVTQLHATSTLSAWGLCQTAGGTAASPQGVVCSGPFEDSSYAIYNVSTTMPGSTGLFVGLYVTPAWASTAELQSIGLSGATGTYITGSLVPYGQDGIGDIGQSDAQFRIGYFGSDVIVGGQSVCLENGTNCPASGGSQNLAQVTALGATATATIQALGGIVMVSSTVTSTLNLPSQFATALLFTDGSRSASSTSRITVNGNTGSVTSTNLFASVASSTNLFANLATIGTLTGGSGAFNTLTVTGQNVCLANGTNCPSGGTQDLESVTDIGATTTNPVYLLGGINTRNIVATGTIIGATDVSSTQFKAGGGAGWGTPSNPGYTFSVDQNTGMLGASAELDFSVDGATRFLSTYALGAPAFGILRTVGMGTSSGAIVPSFSNTSETDTGLSFLTADTLDVVTGGARRFRVGSVSSTFLTHVFPVSNNTMMLGSPTSSWRGVYASGTSEFAFANIRTATATNATATTFFVSNKLRAATVSSTEFIFPCGDTAASPQIHGTGFTTTGIYCDQFGNLGFSIGGTEVFLIDSANTYFSKSFLPAVHNTIDMGDVVRMFRNTYFSGVMYATTSGAGIDVRNTTTTNATTTGIVAFTGLAATGVSGDLVCFQTGGKISHQATNCTVSSARFKENIASLSPEDLLEKTLKLRAVEFDYREGQAPSTGKHSSGFIAEEVARIDPALVVYTSEYTPEDLEFEQKNYPDVIVYKDGQTLIPQTVDYSRISYMTVGAIQAQQDQIKELQNRAMRGWNIIDWIKSFFQ